MQSSAVHPNWHDIIRRNDNSDSLPEGYLAFLPALLQADHSCYDGTYAFGAISTTRAEEESVIYIHSRFAYALHPRVQSDLDNELSTAYHRTSAHVRPSHAFEHRPTAFAVSSLRLLHQQQCDATPKDPESESDAEDDPYRQHTTRAKFASSITPYANRQQGSSSTRTSRPLISHRLALLPPSYSSATQFHTTHPLAVPHDHAASSQRITIQRFACRLVPPRYRDSPPISGLIARRVVVPTVEHRTSSILSSVVSGAKRQAQWAQRSNETDGGACGIDKDIVIDQVSQLGLRPSERRIQTEMRAVVVPVPGEARMAGGKPGLCGSEGDEGVMIGERYRCDCFFGTAGSGDDDNEDGG
ncbi:hypothetical protein C8R45DRAFT_1188834 [Mycena sanguinolenta]|nr:hypothetical protein C8R45DRAFT_1188834 [Mycena sanguinolenta]